MRGSRILLRRDNIVRVQVVVYLLRTYCVCSLRVDHTHLAQFPLPLSTFLSCFLRHVSDLSFGRHCPISVPSQCTRPHLPPPWRVDQARLASLHRRTIEGASLCSSRRCISYIVPLLDKLQTMRCPWGANTVRALRQLQDALERVDNAVLNCPQDSPYSGENGCEYVGALRQLWQRQIEMNLAVQFQRVLDEDVGRSACGIWEERKLLQVASPAGLVDEKVAMEPARR